MQGTCRKPLIRGSPAHVSALGDGRRGPERERPRDLTRGWETAGLQGTALAPQTHRGANANVCGLRTGPQGGLRTPTAVCSGQEAKEFNLRPKLLIVEDDPALREVWGILF